MKNFFGFTLAIVGIITLILGLTRIYSREPNGHIAPEAVVGGVLVLCGMVANTMGANIAKDASVEGFGKISKSLYIASFVTAIVIVIVGLFNVFSPQKMLMSILLLLVGFLSAISSASNAIAEERKKRKSTEVI